MQRVKSTAVDANVISMFERFPSYASLPIEEKDRTNRKSELIKEQTEEQIFLKQYKHFYRYLPPNFNSLLSSRRSHILKLIALKRSIHSKMKDLLVNGNKSIETNTDLISDQEFTYNNDDR